MIRDLESSNKAVGIDIGGTKVKIACIDSGGKIIWSKKEAVVKENITEFLNQIMKLVHKADDYCQIKDYQGIGIALPAVIEQDGDTIIQSPNLSFLEGIKLLSLIRDKLNSISINLPVKLGYDGKASVVAEGWQGCGRNYRNILTVAIGTGIGGGLILEGRVILGFNNVAGAVGWSRLGVDKNTPSFENICAGPAIARQAKNLYDIESTKIFFDQAVKERESVVDLLKIIIKYTGFTMANIVSLLNPEVIIFTGSVGLRFKPYLEDIKRVILTYAQPIAAESIKLACSEFGNDAGVIGAAGFVLSNLGGDKGD